MACKRSRVRISYSPRRIRTGCFDLGTACFAYEGEAFPYGGQTFPFRAGESGLSQRRNPPAGTNGTRFAARPCRDIRPQEYAREPRTDRRSMENSAIPTDKPWLFGLTPSTNWSGSPPRTGCPGPAARQIASWFLPQGSRFDRRMTDLSLKTGEKSPGNTSWARFLRQRAAIGRRHEKIPFPDSAVASSSRPTSPTATGRRSASRRNRVAGWAAAFA